MPWDYNLAPSEYSNTRELRDLSEGRQWQQSLVEYTQEKQDAYIASQEDIRWNLQAEDQVRDRIRAPPTRIAPRPPTAGNAFNQWLVPDHTLSMGIVAAKYPRFLPLPSKFAPPHPPLCRLRNYTPKMPPFGFAPASPTTPGTSATSGPGAPPPRSSSHPPPDPQPRPRTAATAMLAEMAAEAKRPPLPGGSREALRSPASATGMAPRTARGSSCSAGSLAATLRSLSAPRAPMAVTAERRAARLLEQLYAQSNDRHAPPQPAAPLLSHAKRLDSAQRGLSLPCLVALRQFLSLAGWEGQTVEEVSYRATAASSLVRLTRRTGLSLAETLALCARESDAELRPLGPMERRCLAGSPLMGGGALLLASTSRTTRMAGLMGAATTYVHYVEKPPPSQISGGGGGGGARLKPRQTATNVKLVDLLDSVIRLCRQRAAQEEDDDAAARAPFTRYVWIDCLCLSLPLLAGHYNPSMVEAGSAERAAREEPVESSKAAALGAASEVYVYRSPELDAVPLAGHCALATFSDEVEMAAGTPMGGGHGDTRGLGQARLRELEG